MLQPAVQRLRLEWHLRRRMTAWRRVRGLGWGLPGGGHCLSGCWNDAASGRGRQQQGDRPLRLVKSTPPYPV